MNSTSRSTPRSTPRSTERNPALRARAAAVMLQLALAGCATLLLALAGCATRLQAPDAANPVFVAFQNPALDPGNGGALVAAAALRPGDILLTASDGLASAGIRALTFAPVSHAAIYLGDERVAEAVGQGIVVRTLAAVLREESVVVAFRHPGLSPAQAERIGRFAEARVGERYNTLGVLLLAPFALERRVCELPLVPGPVRDFCIRGIAAIQLGAGSSDRFFCSQFVLEAYARAGLPITEADPRLVSPADILHMREGDVPSVVIREPLVYVGHLKLQLRVPRPEPIVGWGGPNPPAPTARPG